jgi:hypothetical protein
MPFSDHASGALSRKAKRLDSAPRHGTLAHAHVKVSPVSLPSLLSFPISIDVLLGLDIESLSPASNQGRFLSQKAEDALKTG